MEKQKRWQWYLILAVIILTLYNILPTVFYYTKPLHSPIDQERAHDAANSIVDRVNELEDDSVQWLYSFSKLLKVKPTSIEIKKDDPGLIAVTFSNEEDVARFQRFLPKAGALIPFVPSQLELAPVGLDANPLQVLVSRQISVHLNPADLDRYFLYSKKRLENGELSPLYRDVVYDRVSQTALALAGPSRNSLMLSLILKSGNDKRYDEAVTALAKEIVDVERSLGKYPALSRRWYATFTQTEGDTDGQIAKFIARMETVKSRLEAEKDSLQLKEKNSKEQGGWQDTQTEQAIAAINHQKSTLDSAIGIIRRNSAEFKQGTVPLSDKEIRSGLANSEKQVKGGEGIQVLNIKGHHPFVDALVIDWANNKVVTRLSPEVQKLRLSTEQSEALAIAQEKMNQLLFNDIARVTSLSDEQINPEGNEFSFKLTNLINSDSFLAFNLGQLAETLGKQMTAQIENAWHPSNTELARTNYAIRGYDQYNTEKAEDKKLGLVVYAPAMYGEEPPQGFSKDSIYVIARGLEAMKQKYQENPSSPENIALMQDIQSLNSILQTYGFIGYSGQMYGIASEFSKDYIFKRDDYYGPLLKATREDFYVQGSKRFAVLDFTDVEQRIMTTNRIDDRIQEDLLKWREEYNQAQVDINTTSRYMIPKPTKNAYWENFKLSLVKYFRGDDRKILKWGLDLSGGKTVRIGLRDHNNREVTNPDDLNTAVNELYVRINKMGVSERTIRIEGNNIVLDFPGSQNLSASELVKASAMYFYIVNEKFTPRNPNIGTVVNDFLQNVWNEAVVMNRKDIENINEIAWRHLGGDSEADVLAISESAKILRENGFKLANPKEATKSPAFNDTISSIAMLKGDDFTQWDNQSHPLLVVFHNYALEGSSLNNVQVGYDPSEGNILTFGIKGAYEGSQSTGNPRDDFYTWTSQFAEDKIAGTPKEAFSQGHGWRMAVILNGKVITHPSLRAALRDGATISGRFSQREINQLAADLKAGSLSFTPKILSEENVSPELGKEERTRSILASLVALVLVAVAMVGYYHFAGVVASAAVLFNILIMWGVLQNLGAALTLPAIAGIVLTIGMAVDANVLVFERFREEFRLSGRLASAIQAGYRKAFSAIIDSNLTTIIVALILIQFDSGPIKGFAVTIIIGIISSMFTALFMTRFFFAGWVQNPQNKTLTMRQFIGETHFDFLAQTKKALIVTAVVMVLGTFMFISQRNTMFGMDFSGGYSLNVEVAEKASELSYREQAYNALVSAGATSNDVQVRELSRPTQLRIQLAMGMEEKGHPFYQMPEELTEGKFTYVFQKNPRINWVVDALKHQGIELNEAQLVKLDQNWTVMSGQFSDKMRNNAIIGIVLALIGILLYITLRFEFKYALAAVVGLVHDVIITLGILALFHKLGFPVQINLEVVGALMMIIGYSLNDTIIVFDRIREDVHILRKWKYSDIINHALNVTLSRTIMTSGTTILVLMALVVLGGHSIFAFSLVMTIGVVVGTLSSLFIAAPVLLFLHNREQKLQHDALAIKHSS